jgi:hypothetical protein
MRQSGTGKGKFFPVPMPLLRRLNGTFRIKIRLRLKSRSRSKVQSMVVPFKIIHLHPFQSSSEGPAPNVVALFSLKKAVLSVSVAIRIVGDFLDDELKMRSLKLRKIFNQ